MSQNRFNQIFASFVGEEDPEISQVNFKQPDAKSVVRKYKMKDHKRGDAMFSSPINAAPSKPTPNESNESSQNPEEQTHSLNSKG